MNHIHRLAAERDAARASLANARAEMAELLCYLASDKFRWPDADYVHVQTDLWPKLIRLRGIISDA